MTLLERLLLVLVALPVAGCNRCGGQAGSEPVGAAAGGGAAPAVNAGVAADGAGSAIGHALSARTIPAGPASEGLWLPEFELLQIAGDADLDWADAAKHCLGRGKSLCSAAQWQRACEEDESIGKLLTWTATADAKGVELRGGAESCRARSIQPPTSKDPLRIGLCCSRAVAIRTEEKSDELKASVAKRILDLEQAIGSGNADSLRSMLADTLSVDGVDFDRQRGAARLLEEQKLEPGSSTYFDRCTMTVLSDDSTSAILADCGIVGSTRSNARRLSRRVVFAGAKGPLTYFGEPGLMKQKEQKERVKAFLPSE